ncbi:flavohemoprotein [Alcaligenes faecalis]|uniref:NO-inducible flavohemoprotein n=1 Tax=Alcaligenes faecalis TaxID=511 RepID=UPI0007C56E48|nr:NO-inducible flavohemoprotein [Alcaligenes faecalis]ARP53638.1 flavohemoprotein [Alcaligenes faecalis]
MLDEHTMHIVKSTAPILQAHGETLTRHFYQRMFKHNPEVAPLFNSSNQSAGTQQRALAGAIAAYAANIDNLGELSEAVELIAQKHVSLQIKPEHYPIVGENLLCSIKEVLGDGATDEVISAWGEAYNFLANILMGREKQIYETNTQQPGGWEGFRTFRVERKVAESNNITSFYLVPEDGLPLPTFKPGQYLTVRVSLPDGSTTMRNYSLSDKPGKPYFRISVKREYAVEANTPDGYVSSLLHQSVQVGQHLEIAAPCGEFYLDTTKQHHRPLALLGAGVGITPIMSILLSALEAMPDREIIFIHASLNESVQAFKPTLDDLAKKHPNLKLHYRYSEPDVIPNSVNTSAGFVTSDLLESMLPSREADYYFCGPKPFMATIYRNLLKWDIPAAQLNFEFFGPREELEVLAQN